jgi:hypothetical protein
LRREGKKILSEETVSRVENTRRDEEEGKALSESRRECRQKMFIVISGCT